MMVLLNMYQCTVCSVFDSIECCMRHFLHCAQRTENRKSEHNVCINITKIYFYRFILTENLTRSRKKTIIDQVYLKNCRKSIRLGDFVSFAFYFALSKCISLVLKCIKTEISERFARF